MRNAARKPPAHTTALRCTVPSLTSDTSGTQKLYLVRSYDIPSDDPSAARLANLSWTYDSAISAVALDSDNDPSQAAQLLDQLSAPQRTDGSLDFAYDTAIATFNGTYSAAGPFSGYRPYATGGPDVLSREGSAQADFTTRLLGLDNSAQDKAIAAWTAITTTRKQGPLQSDKTVTDIAAEGLPS
jgi:hypothetical protein